jgi:hypothetical protein
LGDGHEVISWRATVLIEVELILKGYVVYPSNSCCAENDLVGCGNTSRLTSALVNARTSASLEICSCSGRA